MAQALLTIGIPTYRRPDRLVHLLESIQSQLSAELKTLVEVVISDNGSGDSTWEVCQKYSTEYGFIIHQQPTNVGMDRNVLSVQKLATGEFMWWMGDDDTIVPGFLPYLCGLLKNTSESFIFVPAGIDGQTSKTLGIQENRRGILWDLVCEYGFLRLLGTLGHCVFRVSALQDYETIVPAAPCFAHAFGLLLSLGDKQAIILTKGGFVTRAAEEGYMEDYHLRWKAEGLWTEGFFKCGLLLSGLITDSVIPKPPATFFRMFDTQNWAFQHHVYGALYAKVFEMAEQVSDGELQKIMQLTEFLGNEEYTKNCTALVKAVIHHRATKSILDYIRGIAWPCVATATVAFPDS